MTEISKRADELKVGDVWTETGGVSGVSARPRRRLQMTRSDDGPLRSTILIHAVDQNTGLHEILELYRENRRSVAA